MRWSHFSGERAPVPGSASLIATQPASWEFLPSLEPDLARALDSERISIIRKDIVDLSGACVGLIAPWNKDNVIAPRSVEWILSHSVMEHVEGAEEAYRCCATWLTPGGYMTHEIDYGSHGLTKHWNGHWTVGRNPWRLLKGARPFLINRLPHQAHVAMMERNGMQVLEDMRVRRSDGLDRSAYVAPYAAMSDEDARTHVAFVVCRGKDYHAEAGWR